MFEINPARDTGSCQSCGAQNYDSKAYRSQPASDYVEGLKLFTIRVSRDRLDGDPHAHGGAVTTLCDGCLDRLGKTIRPHRAPVEHFHPCAECEERLITDAVERCTTCEAAKTFRERRDKRSVVLSQRGFDVLITGEMVTVLNDPAGEVRQSAGPRKETVRLQGTRRALEALAMQAESIARDGLPSISWAKQSAATAAKALREATAAP